MTEPETDYDTLYDLDAFYEEVYRLPELLIEAHPETHVPDESIYTKVNTKL